MENFKIDQFKAKGNIAFPWFKSLSTEECLNISQRWRAVMQCELGVSDLDLMNIILSKSEVIKNCSSEDTNFDLSALFMRLGVASNEKVYLNWYRFDRIDEMLLKDLTLHFNDIWYPSSDDLDIFDASYKWLISVAHHGQVTHWKSNERD